MSEGARELSDSQKAVAAIKAITLDRLGLEREMESKIYDLQLSYQARLDEMDEKINKIAQGSEVQESDYKELLSKYPNIAIIDSTSDDFKVDYEPSKGFKNFWLDVLQNDSVSRDMMSTVDVPVLEYLINVKVKQVNPESPFSEYPTFTDRGLILEFHFKENPYFTNKVLYKYYRLAIPVDEEDPFKYEGLVPVGIECCEIEWMPGKNITIKTVKKTQRNRHTKQSRTVTKTEKVESFFNFFSKIDPSELHADGESDAEDILSSLMFSEYHFLNHIHTALIPKSIFYFLDEVEQELEEEEASDDYDSEESDNPPYSCVKSRRSDGFLPS